MDALASSAHNMIKKVLGKPDQYIAVDVIISPNLQFGGNREPAAVVSLPCWRQVLWGRWWLYA